MTRKKEEFVPIEPNKVKMYVCGPTVYNYIHIGNARADTVFDMVRRYFEHKGYEVTLVRNFTDVDDKIINRAREEGCTAEDVSNRYIDEYLKDIKGMGVRQASHCPRVTEEMDSIISMIETLIDKGFAYCVNGTVFFDTAAFTEYGKLSKKNLEDLNMGIRIEVDAEKNNPSDFVLWKPAKPGEPVWDSPWSGGRPGWHIECSAMAKTYLGDTIDIHCGGSDLVFPHHENEIAQSEAANGKVFANYWMHNGFINVDNEKMSKSKNNFFTLREVAEKYSYEIVRFFLLSAHYRSPVNYSVDLVAASANSLERIKNCLRNMQHFMENSTGGLSDAERELLKDMDGFEAEFEACMEDDFNSADAIAAIFMAVRFANVQVNADSSKEFVEQIITRIKGMCDILGILVDADTEAEDVELIEQLLAKREAARKNKNWAEADAIRGRLLSMNIVIEDTAQGARWVKKL